MSIWWISLILIFVVLKCHWYFLQENPDTIVQILNAMGIDAYRGATQLNIIEPEKWNPHLDYFAPLIHYYPHEARYLIDHVVYLPVNKSVPFHVLDQICKGLEVAIKISRNGRGVSVRPQSKLWSPEKSGFRISYCLPIQDHLWYLLSSRGRNAFHIYKWPYLLCFLKRKKLINTILLYDWYCLITTICFISFYWDYSIIHEYFKRCYSRKGSLCGSFSHIGHKFTCIH